MNRIYSYADKLGGRAIVILMIIRDSKTIKIDNIPDQCGATVQEVEELLESLEEMGFVQYLGDRNVRVCAL